MHYHVWGSCHAKFDDDGFNTFRRIACEGHTHTDRQTLASSILKLFKVVSDWKKKEKRKEKVYIRNQQTKPMTRNNNKRDKQAADTALTSFSWSGEGVVGEAGEVGVVAMPPPASSPRPGLSCTHTPESRCLSVTLLNLHGACFLGPIQYPWQTRQNVCSSWTIFRQSSLWNFRYSIP